MLNNLYEKLLCNIQVTLRDKFRISVLRSLLGLISSILTWAITIRRYHPFFRVGVLLLLCERTAFLFKLCFNSSVGRAQG